MNIFAFTPAEGSHPPYVSLNEENDDKIVLSVREGPAENFKIATIELPLEELEILHQKLGDYLNRRLSK